MALNSPRPAEVAILAARRQALVAQTDATSPVGGGAVSDAATLQGHSASYFAPASHTHPTAAIPAYALGAEPAAASGWAGKMIMVTDSGNPTLLYICMQNSAGGYEWIAIGQSS